MELRPAVTADVPAAAATIALAFADDPVWGPILRGADGSSDHLPCFWTPFVEGALRHGTVWLVDDGASIAVWIPPGGDEMTEEQFEQARAIVDEELDPAQQGAFTELMRRFDANHPHSEPHYYLSLLATHPSRRGEGLAQQMLAENVRAFGEQGFATYLESTNPANDRRYERAGFRTIGGFASPFDDAPVTTMWRPIDA